MQSDKIGVGIIGLSATGGWAATAHVPALRALSDHFEIVGLSSSSPQSAKAAAEKYDVPFYTASPSELAARPDVDLVVVTVKVPHHRELVQAAIDAGKMVYCEWPLGNGLNEAIAIADAARKRNVRTFIGLQARSAPPVRFLRDLIRERHVGEVLSTSVISSAGSPWGGVATSGSVYATDRSTGASMLTIPFGHTIDALSWILGDFERIGSTLATRRKSVQLSDTGSTVEANAPDQVAVSGLLHGGAVASLHYRGGFSRGTNFLWEINGTKGDIVVTGGVGHLQFAQIKIQAASGDDKILSDLPVPDNYRQVTTDPTSLSDAVAHAYRNVLDDIRNGTKHVPDFDEAVRLHQLLDTIENRAV